MGSRKSSQYTRKSNGPDFSTRDQKIIVKYLNTQKYDVTEIHKLLVGVCGEEGAASYKAVRDWIQELEDGYEDPSEALPLPVAAKSEMIPEPPPTDPALVARIETVIRLDRRVSLDQIADMALTTRHSVQHILNNVLGLKKIFERWVPRLWTPEQRLYRVQVCQELLNRYESEGDRFLGRIITGEEGFVHYYMPDTFLAQQAPTKYEAGEKYKPQTEPKRLFYAFFYDMRGLLLSCALENVAPTAEQYANIIELVLIPAIKSKRKGVDFDAQNPLLIIQDNTPVHNSAVVKAAFSKNNLEVLSHAPASPDLEPHEYWFFPHLRNLLKIPIFKSKFDLQSALTHHLNSISDSEFGSSINRLPDRWARCIDNQGLYVL